MEKQKLVFYKTWLKISPDSQMLDVLLLLVYIEDRRCAHLPYRN